MSGQIPLRYQKSWFRFQFVEEIHWDEIANKSSQWALRTHNNLNQIALDMGGPNYVYNNVGTKTQTVSILSRLNQLELGQSQSVQNLGLDFSVVGTVGFVGADGQPLSEENPLTVVVNSATAPGQLVTGTFTTPFSITLTGAGWGQDTLGDLSNTNLFVYAIHTGTAIIIGIGAQSNRLTVDGSECSNIASTINLANEMLTTATFVGAATAFECAWFQADFDDTGNAGGENFWTPETPARVGEQYRHGFSSSFDRVDLSIGGAASAMRWSSSGVNIPAGNKFFFDAVAGVGGDTYIYESSANSVSVVTGGFERLRISTTEILSFLDVVIPATGKFFVDGGFDTWIYEQAANVVALHIGGVDRYFFTQTEISIAAGHNIVLAALGRCYFDGGLNTYIVENVGDSIDIVTGGISAGTFNSAGLLLPVQDPPEANRMTQYSGLKGAWRGNTTTPTTTSDYNVSAVNKIGTGLVQIVWDTNFVTAAQCIFGVVAGQGVANNAYGEVPFLLPPAATDVHIGRIDFDDGANTDQASDGVLNVLAFGVQ